MESAGAEPSQGGDEQACQLLHQAVEAWLAGLPEGTLLPTEGGLLRLEVEILELAASRAHPQLLEALLKAPGKRSAGSCTADFADWQRTFPHPLPMPALALSTLILKPNVPSISLSSSIPSPQNVFDKLSWQCCRLLTCWPLGSESGCACTSCPHPSSSV